MLRNPRNSRKEGHEMKQAGGRPVKGENPCVFDIAL